MPVTMPSLPRAVPHNVGCDVAGGGVGEGGQRVAFRVPHAAEPLERSRLCPRILAHNPHRASMRNLARPACARTKRTDRWICKATVSGTPQCCVHPLAVRIWQEGLSIYSRRLYYSGQGPVWVAAIICAPTHIGFLRLSVVIRPLQSQRHWRVHGQPSAKAS